MCNTSIIKEQSQKEMIINKISQIEATAPLLEIKNKKKNESYINENKIQNNNKNEILNDEEKI